MTGERGGQGVRRCKKIARRAKAFHAKAQRCWRRKEKKQFFFVRLCDLAPWRELFDFFTRSECWGLLFPSP
jgi:hypothetical protein